MKEENCKELRLSLEEARVALQDFEKLLVAGDPIFIESKNKFLLLLDKIEDFFFTTILSKKFNELFPQAKIEKIEPDRVPSDIMDSFEHQSSMYIHPDDYEKGNFIRFYIIRRADTLYTTYVAEQDKTYDVNETEELTERLHYFVDDPDDLGLDELRFNMESDESYFKNKPFAYFSKNGTDRLKIMNAFCQARFDLAMHSGTLLGDDEHDFWKELIEEDLAEQYEEESGRDLKTRYKFKD